MAQGSTPGQRAAKRKLKALRGGMRLSQAEFAKVAGVSLRTLQRFESPDGGWPYADTLTMLSQAIGEPEEYLQEFADRYDEGIMPGQADDHEAAKLDVLRRALNDLRDAVDSFDEDTNTDSASRGG